jgi:hypothetical protein
MGYTPVPWILLLATFIPIPSLADLGEDLLTAVRKGDAARVKVLLEQGADVNAKSPYGATGLFFAADRGNMEIIRILIDHGADVKVKDTFYGASAVTWAAMKSHADVIKLLLSKGAPDADNALMTGISNGNVETVKAALEYKSQIKSEMLSQALAEANSEKHTEIAELLKSAGAVPPVKPNFQIDPEVLKTYSGTYSGDGFEVKFDIVDGKLTGGPIGQKPEAYDAVDSTTFQHPVMTMLKLSFNVEAGKVSSLSMKRGANKPAVLKKVATTK